MLTLPWRRVGSTSALALVLVVGLPALAQAQLFPNLWIRRQRPPADTESPFYKQVRSEYYGYYPTCWRKFPEGWACPTGNPEAPDAAVAFARKPRDPKPPAGSGGPDDVDGMGAPGGAPAPDPGLELDPPNGRPGRAPGGTPTMPPVPGDPFVTPKPSGGNTGAAPAGPGGAKPRTPSPLDPFPTTDPFDPLPGTTPPRQTSPLPLPENPTSPRVDRDPAPAADASEVVVSLPEMPGLGGDAVGNGRALALPEMAPAANVAAAGDAAALTSMPSSLPPTATTVDPPPPQRTQAPRRPSLIGNFINWTTQRWR